MGYGFVPDQTPQLAIDAAVIKGVVPGRPLRSTGYGFVSDQTLQLAIDAAVI